MSLDIDSVGIHANLLQLGLNADGSIEVPPSDPGSPPGWYDKSPTPGEQGPSVILAHSHDLGGPGVFAAVPRMRPGDRVAVTREDGRTVTFEVYRAEAYPKSGFPTQKVYGNTEGAELRLITCDRYIPEREEWDDNFVVYARMVS